METIQKTRPQLFPPLAITSRSCHHTLSAWLLTFLDLCHHPLSSMDLSSVSHIAHSRRVHRTSRLLCHLPLISVQSILAPTPTSGADRHSTPAYWQLEPLFPAVFARGRAPNDPRLLSPKVLAYASSVTVFVHLVFTVVLDAIPVAVPKAYKMDAIRMSTCAVCSSGWYHEWLAANHLAPLGVSWSTRACWQAAAFPSILSDATGYNSANFLTI